MLAQLHDKHCMDQMFQGDQANGAIHLKLCKLKEPSFAFEQQT